KYIYSEYRMIYVNDSIIEDWIASVVDHHASLSRTAVAVTNGVHHPGGGSYQGAGFGQALCNHFPVPAQPRACLRFMSVHGLPPTDEVSVRNHQTGHAHRQIAVTHLVEVQQVRLYFFYKPSQ